MAVAVVLSFFYNVRWYFFLEYFSRHCERTVLRDIQGGHPEPVHVDAVRTFQPLPPPTRSSLPRLSSFLLIVNDHGTVMKIRFPMDKTGRPTVEHDGQVVRSLPGIIKLLSKVSPAQCGAVRVAELLLVSPLLSSPLLVSSLIYPL